MALHRWLPLVLLVLVPSACRPSPTVGSEPTRSVPAATAEPLNPPPTLPARAPREEWTTGIVDRPRPDVPPVILKSIGVVTQDFGERIVFEFQGSQLPGYRLEQVEGPVRQCASGKVVKIEGAARLQIRLSPAQGHTEEGQSTVAHDAWNPGMSIIREMMSTCDFEGDVTWVVGLASPYRFRVQEMTNPTRLVVDFRH
jgi:hypothetical protein